MDSYLVNGDTDDPLPEWLEYRLYWPDQGATDEQPLSREDGCGGAAGQHSAR